MQITVHTIREIMVLPIIILIGIPIFLGIVYMPPFDLPEQIEPEVVEEPEVISREPNLGIVYFMMMVIWIIFLLRIMVQLKRGTFKVTQRY